MLRGAEFRIPRYVYFMQQEREQGDRSSRGAGQSVRQGTALAALGGALIGALTGLAGSLLVYVQAEETQKTASNGRQADIRRAAYVGLGTSFQSFKTEITGVRNFIINPTVTKEQREDQYNKMYVPAYDRLMQADVTVRLVGTAVGKDVLAQSVPQREKVKDMIAAAFTAAELDTVKFAKEFDDALLEYEQAINAVIDKVDAEVL
ncbi:hypothetical protein AMK20_19135 [Streptomyces sp. TSRI0261]|nr:hypothetical protein AMK20_19135 [Streptomyces sp. TSRI0261]